MAAEPADDGKPSNETPRLTPLQLARQHPALRAWLLSSSVEWGAITFMAVALGYLVHAQTGSALWVGLQVAALTLPYTLLSLSIGRALDRYERRRLLLIAYSAEIAIAAALAVLYWTGNLGLGAILVASLLFGILLTFEVPANWLVIESYTPPEQLTNVFAISSTASNLSIMAFMLVGGAVLSILGFGYTCLLYILAATPVLFVIMRQRRTPPVHASPPDDGAGLRQEFRGTLRILRRDRPLSLSLLLTLAVGCLILPVLSQLPTLADWAGGEAFLTTAFAAAAYVGAALVAPILSITRRRGSGLGAIVATAFTVGAVALAISGVVGELLEPADRSYLVVPALVIIGAALTVATVNLTSTVQTSAPEDQRGHFLGISGLLLDGVLPISAILWGIVSDRIDMGYTMALAAGILGCVVVYHRARRHFRILDGVSITQTR